MVEGPFAWEHKIGSLLPTAIGIDPSLTAGGLAFPTGECLLFGHDGVTKMSWVDQDATILHLVGSYRTVIQNYGPLPDLAVIEWVDMSSSYGGSAERVVLVWELTRMLRGLGITVVTAASSIGKMYATGKGAGPKGAVIEAVTRQWPQFQTRGNDNKADAAAFCALGMEILGRPLSMTTVAQQRALTRVKPLDQAPTPKKRATKKVAS